MVDYNNKITVNEYLELRKSVDWLDVHPDQAAALIENSDYLIACREDESIVGCARIFWDKGYIAYLADVMVKPEYQKQGIGKKMVGECISHIERQLKEGWRIKIVIVSSKGKEEFYEKFGFIRRPDEREGYGMQAWRSY